MECTKAAAIPTETIPKTTQHSKTKKQRAGEAGQNRDELPPQPHTRNCPSQQNTTASTPWNVQGRQVNQSFNVFEITIWLLIQDWTTYYKMSDNSDILKIIIKI